MGKRHQARELALKTLFQLEVSDDDPDEDDDPSGYWGGGVEDQDTAPAEPSSPKISVRLRIVTILALKLVLSLRIAGVPHHSA